jgi:hypothetical protein
MQEKHRAASERSRPERVIDKADSCEVGGPGVDRVRFVPLEMRWSSVWLWVARMAWGALAARFRHPLRP